MSQADNIRRGDIKRNEAEWLAPVASARESSEDKERAAAERARNPLLHITHHAFACRDAEETQRFYEDILRMPLVAAVVLDDPFRDDHAPYCHFFFEMADGNCLAFFDHSDHFRPEDFEPKSGFHHHLAMEVGSDETVQEYRARLSAAGIPNSYIDHGPYHSLYFIDPNGLNLEITFKAPGTREYENASRQIARKTLDDWRLERQGVIASMRMRQANTAS